MQEEIFRFSIVRNPKRYSSEKLETSVIHLVDEPIEKYPNYKSLLEVKKKNPTREEFISFLEKRQNDNNNLTLKQLSELTTKIPKFSAWLLTQNKINKKPLVEKSKQLFGSLSDLVKSSDFKKDKYLITESLLVAAIIEPKQPGLRSELMRARRLIFLLEFLAKNKNVDTKAIRKILNTTILLPSALFPIPNKNSELREKREAARKERKEIIKKRATEINSDIEKLKINNEAIEELTAAYSKHLFEEKKYS